jgi:hypothetical protein
VMSILYRGEIHIKNTGISIYSGFSRPTRQMFAVYKQKPIHVKKKTPSLTNIIKVYTLDDRKCQAAPPQ